MQIVVTKDERRIKGVHGVVQSVGKRCPESRILKRHRHRPIQPVYGGSGGFRLCGFIIESGPVTVRHGAASGYGTGPDIVFGNDLLRIRRPAVVLRPPLYSL